VGAMVECRAVLDLDAGCQEAEEILRAATMAMISLDQEPESAEERMAEDDYEAHAPGADLERRPSESAVREVEVLRQRVGLHMRRGKLGQAREFALGLQRRMPHDEHVQRIVEDLDALPAAHQQLQKAVRKKGTARVGGCAGWIAFLGCPVLGALADDLERVAATSAAFGLLVVVYCFFSGFRHFRAARRLRRQIAGLKDAVEEALLLVRL